MPLHEDELVLARPSPGPAIVKRMHADFPEHGVEVVIDNRLAGISRVHFPYEVVECFRNYDRKRNPAAEANGAVAILHGRDQLRRFCKLQHDQQALRQPPSRDATVRKLCIVFVAECMVCGCACPPRFHEHRVNRYRMVHRAWTVNRHDNLRGSVCQLADKGIRVAQVGKLRDVHGISVEIISGWFYRSRPGNGWQKKNPANEASRDDDVAHRK